MVTAYRFNSVVSAVYLIGACGRGCFHTWPHAPIRCTVDDSAPIGCSASGLPECDWGQVDALLGRSSSTQRAKPPKSVPHTKTHTDLLFSDQESRLHVPLRHENT